MSKPSLCAFAAALLSMSSLTAAAQNWPSRPITMVVPFAAGGSIDIPARRLAADLSAKLGQQVIVENRSGANGNIGGGYVAKASPDGYTLMFSPPGVLATNRFMYRNMPFDSDRAFAPIILLAKSPMVLAAHPKVPVNNLQELIAYAKANPGRLSVGTPGIGSQAHLTMELLQKSSGTQMNYVPYRGAAGSGTDVIAGPWHRSDDAHALEAVAKRPERCRIRLPRLRGRCLLQRGGARRHAAGDHPNAE